MNRVETVSEARARALSLIREEGMSFQDDPRFPTEEFPEGVRVLEGNDRPEPRRWHGRPCGIPCYGDGRKCTHSKTGRTTFKDATWSVHVTSPGLELMAVEVRPGFDETQIRMYFRFLKGLREASRRDSLQESEA
jgi:hypothetical protein